MYLEAVNSAVHFSVPHENSFVLLSELEMEGESLPLVKKDFLLLSLFAQLAGRCSGGQSLHGGSFKETISSFYQCKTCSTRFSALPAAQHKPRDEMSAPVVALSLAKASVLAMTE